MRINRYYGRWYIQYDIFYKGKPASAFSVIDYQGTRRWYEVKTADYNTKEATEPGILSLITIRILKYG
jgi:hypothetical protein